MSTPNGLLSPPPPDQPSTSRMTTPAKRKRATSTEEPQLSNESAANVVDRHSPSPDEQMKLEQLMKDLLEVLRG